MKTGISKVLRVSGLAGLVLMLVMTFFLAASALAAPVIVNGSFETGDYTGWTLWESNSSAQYGTWGIAYDGEVINRNDYTYDFYDGIMVMQRSPGLPITYQATDGGYLVYQLQNGSQCHRMYQDVTFPAGAVSLSWDMWYNNHNYYFSSRQFLAVHIRDLSDNILQTLFITTQGVSLQSIPMTSFSADISAYAGTTVRLDVEMNVLSFFFDAAFDNFAVPTACLPLSQGYWHRQCKATGEIQDGKSRPPLLQENFAGL